VDSKTILRPRSAAVYSRVLCRVFWVAGVFSLRIGVRGGVTNQHNHLPIHRGSVLVGRKMKRWPKSIANLAEHREIHATRKTRGGWSVFYPGQPDEYFSEHHVIDGAPPVQNQSAEQCMECFRVLRSFSL
jgi:hypothetical protein